MSQGQCLRARELAQYDDIATSLCVDPGVGFTTHKMNPRFRHVKGRFGKLRGVLDTYSRDGNAERAYETLVSGNWARTFLMGKPKSTVAAFRGHVRETGFSRLGRVKTSFFECVGWEGGRFHLGLYFW